MGGSNKLKKNIFKEMLDNEEFTNLTLVTEDGGRFNVHLESRSVPAKRFLSSSPVRQSSFFFVLSRDMRFRNSEAGNTLDLVSLNMDQSYEVSQ
ncbi:hypothetical protein JTE90_004555 [Oedothorax gibbosus]|uniref:Uncharacterized protein n=1 Tax=Oedothorax gibbosus TaxID=931172 RepID=A0AAV6UKP4_9ARAC|nr:hypothetical protein JTE90_004555 [Oedothorax gibbosus]